MTTFFNKNKVLALSTICAATLLVFSTIAVCSFCGCASAKNLQRETPLSNPYANSAFSHTFKIDDSGDMGRAHTMDIVLYNNEGEVEKVYTPIVNTFGVACSGK